MFSVRITDELLKDWTQTKQFTLEVADAMPAEFYDFKPTPEEMTFGQQMAHLAGANIYRFYQLSGAKPPLDLHAMMKLHDRDAMIKALGQSFDYVLAIPYSASSGAVRSVLAAEGHHAAGLPVLT